MNASQRKSKRLPRTEQYEEIAETLFELPTTQWLKRVPAGMILRTSLLLDQSLTKCVRLSYVRKLHCFFDYCAKRRIDPVRANISQIVDFILLLEMTGYTHNAISNSISAIAYLYKRHSHWP